VPQVASDVQAYANTRPLPPARTAPSPDQALVMPFASLLNDSAQSAPDSPPPPASDDRPSDADRPDRSPSVRNSGSQAADNNSGPADAKSGNAKSADAKSTDAAATDNAAATDSSDAALGHKTGKADKTATNSKVKSDAQAAADGKIAAQGASGDDSKPAGDKPTAGQAAAAIAVAPGATPIPTIAPTDAFASVLAPVPGAVPQSTSPATANAVTGAAIVETSQAKPGARVTPQSVKSSNEAKLGTEVASQPQSVDKPQATTGDADKDAVANARGEIVAKGNHVNATDAPGTSAADTNAAAPKTIADAFQPNVLTAPTQNTAQTAAIPAAVAPPLAPQVSAVPLAGVAIEIAGKALEGKNHFDIRLDPPELGRIEVHLDVDKDGNVTSRMIADRSDTLDLLRRDASGLERALQDAGLKTADNSLQFSLRDHSTGQQQANGGSNTARLVAEDNTLIPIEAVQRGYSRLAGQGSGIDIHV
jgi:flagellar hook-length control protein FliK